MLKGKVKIILMVLMIAFVGIQFIPSVSNEDEQVLSTDFINLYKPNSEVKQMLKISCYDCHSNHTAYPWYGAIQPIRMFLDHHVTEGKTVLNFSEFGTYSKRKQRNKLKSMANQIGQNKMPLKGYTVFHKDAVLKSKERKELLSFIDQLLSEL